jgi:transposase
MDDRRLYQTVLGLSAPWEVNDVEVELEAEEVRVHVEPADGATLTCPECGEAAAGYDRAPERRWRHLDTCQFRTILVSRVPRVNCAEHGVRQVRVPWAEDRSRFTALFEAWAIRLLRESTIAGTAGLLGISWDEAEGIFRRAVGRGLARRGQEPVRVVGIDETSFQKRHEYVTVVVDLEGDRVLWVGNHRRKQTLEAYWESRPLSERAGLEAIVMDMWDPYIAATRDSVPEGLSKVVFDRFHVMQQLHRAMDDVRRQEQAELRHAGQTDRLQQLKGSRYTWLKGQDRRSERDEALIRTAQRAGFKVGRAWALKEAAREFWNCATPAAAQAFFQQWYRWALDSQLPPVIKAARTVRRYLYGILRYTEQPYTNAMTEGLNSKIQMIKYRARGYRNRENFRLAILFHCGRLDMNPC